MIANDAVWFVTGASAGFGREIVRAAAARGARVAATARRPEALADLVALAPDRIAVFACDVTDAASIAAAVTAAQDRFGQVDVLVNNAGYGLMSTVEEASDAEVRRQFETNLFGAAALMRALVPGMRERRSGLVINISSVAGSRGFAGSGYYSAAKAALEALTESLEAELGEYGVHGMIVAPGPFRTLFFNRSIAVARSSHAEYARIVEGQNAYLATDGAQVGDPARGADVIVEAALSAKVPLRLPLGAQAIDWYAGGFKAKLAEAGERVDLAPKADFPAEELSA